MKKLFMAAAAFLTVVTGCSLKEACESAEGDVYVRFDMVASGTKSSQNADESGFSNVNLFAYSDGNLVNEAYISDFSDGIGMTLPVGSTYNVYALVNIGDCEAPVSEGNLSTLRCTLSSIEDYSKTGLPMAGKTELTPGPFLSSAEIVLTRLVSKVSFKVDADELGGFSVTSVKVKQSALDVLPFSDASAATVVSDGDYASDSDVEAINAGGSASFYVLENCQGVLLPDNTDPWQKVPGNIPEKAELCTYVEVEAELDGSNGLSGSSVYRFYLGQDATTDFNVIRNTSSLVTLKVTLDGLDQISWKIDPDLSYGEIAYTLAAADFVGQWGIITFPEASAAHPVTMTFEGKSMTIPSDNSDYLGNPKDDAPNLMVYTGSSSNKVYICQGYKKVDLTLAQDAISQTLTVEASENIGWAVSMDSDIVQPPGSTFTVNEDGTDAELHFYLWDMDEGKILSPNLFSMPDAVIEVIDPVREVSHEKRPMYWYFDLDLITENDALADVTSWDQWFAATEDEAFLYRRDIYGLAADGSNPAYTVLRSSQNYAGKDTSYNIEIDPAFPDQRHLGEVYNYQLAFGDLCSNTASLPLYQTYEGTRRASWQLGRGTEWAEGDSEREFDNLVVNGREKVLVELSLSGSSLKFTFSEPTSAAEYEFVGGGTYHIRGTVTNSHSGLPIYGDYSADIVLYLVVGAEANVYEDDIVYMDISYMPAVSRLGAATDEEFRDVWNTDCDWIGVVPESGNYSYNYTAFGTCVYSYDNVPDNVVHDVDNLDELYDELLEFANRELTVRYGSDFKFYNKQTGSTGTVLKTEYAGVIVEAHRLQDIESGVYFVEDYFGSFDKY